MTAASNNDDGDNNGDNNNVNTVAVDNNERYNNQRATQLWHSLFSIFYFLLTLLFSYVHHLCMNFFLFFLRFSCFLLWT
jgi:hypothetical protein